MAITLLNHMRLLRRFVPRNDSLLKRTLVFAGSNLYVQVHNKIEMLGLLMRRTVILSAILSISILLSLGCDNTNEVKIGPEIDSVSTVINIEIFENTEARVTNLELRCQTDSIYHCTNFLIEYDLAVTSNNIALTFTGINDPTICQTALGPATSFVNLGALANITYTFSITVDRVIVPAQLILTDSTIEIVGGDSTWTHIVRPVLYRVPAITIWGEVGYNAFARDSALRFFFSLINIGASPARLSTGHYGYFFIHL